MEGLAHLFEEEYRDPEDEEGGPTYAGHEERGFLTWIGLASKTEPEDDEDEDNAKKDSTFIASTGSVDRYGDVVDQKSWILKAYLRNSAILSDHVSRDVVGTSKKTWRGRGEDGKTPIDLRSRVRWDDDEKNPRGVLIAHQHRTGFRKAVSVGFIPHKMTNRTKLPADHYAYVDPTTVKYEWLAGYFYEQNELLEISSVGVPANSEALQQSYEVWKSETRDAALERYVRGTTPNAVADMLVSMIQRDANVRKSILALVLSERTASKSTSDNQGDRRKSFPHTLLEG